MVILKDREIIETLLKLMVPFFTGTFFTISSFIILLWSTNRKIGTKILGTFKVTHSNKTEDTYISEVTLLNMKEIPIVIYNIYISLEKNYFLLVENFEKEPLILKPFEAMVREYDPIDVYTETLMKIKIDKLLFVDLKKELLLETSNGYYKVKKVDRENKWKFIRNKKIINPNRLFHRGKSYGNNTLYIVDFEFKGKISTIIIYKDDILFNTYRGLTQKDIESKETVKEYFEEKKKNKTINYDEIQVYDYQEKLKMLLFSEVYEEVEVERKNKSKKG